MNERWLARARGAAANPIWLKCARARLRLGHVLSWGMVTVSVTAFVCLIVYLTATERELTDRIEAARATLLPVIVIQMVILMLLGTGAVASGLAHERDEKQIDYHRMTPMSPTGKILGFLFGLPVREYFLFALTLPFLAWAAVVGKFPVLTLLHFYVVFFSSVWLYHLTGFVAGMVSAKPRRAAILAQGLVVLLYLILPQLSFVGLSFFEFLTVRPTLYGMVLHELNTYRPGLDRVATQAFSELDRYREFSEVPFFQAILHPTVYALMVQAFLLVSMFVVVYRKWKDEENHPLSKLQAVLFHATILLFLVGSLWPCIAQETRYEELVQRLGSDVVEPVWMLLIMLFVFLIVCGLVGLFLIATITPRRDIALRGLRRARKLRRRAVSPLADAAPGSTVALLIAVLTGAGCLALLELAHGTGRFFDDVPGPWTWAAPIVLFAAVLLFFQAILERFGGRVTFVAVFLLWMLPLFTSMILFAAWESWVTGTWVGLPFPAFGGGLALTNFFQSCTLPEGRTVDFLPPLREYLGLLSESATIFYVGLAVLAQAGRWRWRRRLAA